MKKLTMDGLWARGRVDIARCAILAILISLLWCAVEDRWTIASWQTPVDYLTDPEKSDGISVLAGVRASRDGHVLPFQFTNIPELGAPGVANWDDFPATEKFVFMLMGLLAWGFGIFAAANIVVMLGHVLAAISFYAACRLLNSSWIWAFAGAVAFGLSRFEFSHGLHHITVSYLWHVPLCLVVCEWLICGEGVRVGEGRFIFALVVAFVTGLQNVYYTWLFIQFAAFGGLHQMWRRGWSAALAPALIIGTAVLAFTLINANTFLYDIIHGPNLGAVHRLYSWLELYALKPIDLIMPPPDHAFPPFAAWGANHMAEIYLPPGELPPSGYLGVLGLAAMVWLVLVSCRRTALQAALPLEALMIIWIFIYGMVGGLNGLLGAMGFQLFRATTRYSIVVLCLVLMFAVRRLSAIEFRKQWLPVVLAAGVVVIAWYDQTPQVTDQDINEIADQVSSDRKFTEAMEQSLPPGAMVLQLPLMDYPESPAPGVSPYDHFRPYIYTKSLRFSFGTDKGRPETAWQHTLSQTSLNDLLAQLATANFQAIYVNRNAFQDKGAGLINALKSLGQTEVIDSPRGDLFCVILKKK